jgi:dinuclear metal center YbgI/SA1388 family protein
MIIKDIINTLEELAPLAYAEDFDNVGLLVGDKNTPVTGILVVLDTLENIIEEALEKKCNLIVSFHPIVFSGIKKFNGQDYVNRTVLKAIQNHVAIYAIHTALDQVYGGVNDRICEQLQLSNRKILIPKQNQIKKLSTYAPKEAAENLRKHLFNVGAGAIGNYSNCSFNNEGQGTYMGNDLSNPFKGLKNNLHKETEIQINVVFEKHLEHAVLAVLFNQHPYEEVAYEITTTDNKNQNVGMGMIGELANPLTEHDFLTHVKKHMKTPCIRHSEFLGKSIKKIAVLGGSGSFAINHAKQQGADAFITADLKYHEFFKAEQAILLCDIGHYESEQHTKNLLVEFLTKKFRNLAVILSGINTNPINYF